MMAIKIKVIYFSSTYWQCSPELSELKSNYACSVSGDKVEIVFLMLHESSHHSYRKFALDHVGSGTQSWSLPDIWRATSVMLSIAQCSLILYWNCVQCAAWWPFDLPLNVFHAELIFPKLFIWSVLTHSVWIETDIISLLFLLYLHGISKLCLLSNKHIYYF